VALVGTQYSSVGCEDDFATLLIPSLLLVFYNDCYQILRCTPSCHMCALESFRYILVLAPQTSWSLPPAEPRGRDIDLVLFCEVRLEYPVQHLSSSSHSRCFDYDYSAKHSGRNSVAYFLE
jgi:hypothetical protein